nr:hypothetical protein GCM10020092_059860 [Actinoplanes digitatis]
MLRLTQAAAGDGQHVVTTRVTGLAGYAEASATSRFELSITDEDRERIRWYLEDFLEYPLDPAPAIAADVEGRLAEIGSRLFDLVFAGEEARELWAGLRGVLHTVRVEVACEVDAAAMLPWELLRDPRTNRPVVLEAAEYVRVNAQPAKRVPLPHGRRRRAAAGAAGDLLGRAAATTCRSARWVRCCSRPRRPGRSST